jgi:hypothetical protein
MLFILSTKFTAYPLLFIQIEEMNAVALVAFPHFVCWRHGTRQHCKQKRSDSFTIEKKMN